jgi:WD40 repeat protein
MGHEDGTFIWQGQIPFFSTSSTHYHFVEAPLMSNQFQRIQTISSAHPKAITAAAISCRITWLATADGDGNISIWNCASGTPVNTFIEAEYRGGITALEWDPVEDAVLYVGTSVGILFYLNIVEVRSRPSATNRGANAHQGESSPNWYSR